MTLHLFSCLLKYRHLTIYNKFYNTKTFNLELKSIFHPSKYLSSKSIKTEQDIIKLYVKRWAKWMLICTYLAYHKRRSKTFPWSLTIQALIHQRSNRNPRPSRPRLQCTCPTNSWSKCSLCSSIWNLKVTEISVLFNLSIFIESLCFPRLNNKNLYFIIINILKTFF